MGFVILVGVDGSEASDRAVAYACDQAKERGGQVVCAHVIPWSPYSFTTPEDNEERLKQRNAELKAAEEQVLAPAVEIVGDALPCSSAVKHGDRVDVLLEMAQEFDANQIIVGRTGENPLRRALFATVPSRLVLLADVPVTVVP